MSVALSIIHTNHPQKGAETKKSELLVLDPKRSNAINIGMTVLPAVHVIKTAILNFDEFAISKEGIEVGLSIQSMQDWGSGGCVEVKLTSPFVWSRRSSP